MRQEKFIDTTILLYETKAFDQGNRELLHVLKR